jgi:ribosomal protein L11 methyltransferase
MRRRPCWRISVLTTREAEEAVTELLERVFKEPASSYTDLETGATRVASYLPSKPHGFRAKRIALQAALNGLTAFGLNIGTARVSLSALRTRDWAEAWKRHFKPIEIGSALLIRPSWNHRRPRTGQELIVLDPGLSFGTGQHPTTLFCLQQIVDHRDPAKPQSCLDLGTGSGILALAAAKLGYKPVEGWDNDPEAIRAARANGKKNGVLHRVVFRLKDINQLAAHPERKHSLICANLLSTLILELRQRILQLLAPDGLLVLAGILRREFPGIQTAFEAAGLRLVKSRARKEWRSGAWCWKRPA